MISPRVTFLHIPDTKVLSLIVFICRLFIAQLLSPQVSCCLFLNSRYRSTGMCVQKTLRVSLNPPYNYEELTTEVCTVLWIEESRQGQVSSQRAFFFLAAFSMGLFLIVPHGLFSSALSFFQVFLLMQSKITDRICINLKQMVRLRTNRLHSSFNYDQNSVHKWSSQ